MLDESWSVDRRVWVFALTVSFFGSYAILVEPFIEYKNIQVGKDRERTSWIRLDGIVYILFITILIGLLYSSLRFVRFLYITENEQTYHV